MRNPIPPRGTVPSLDGWRAVAILMVLGSHFLFAEGFPAAADRGLRLAFDGDFGVRIFFVISGFLISLLILREAEQNGEVSLRSFYIRRFLRIIPIYVTYLAALGLFASLGLYHDPSSSWIGALTFTRNMVGRGDSATAHFWSLAIEEQFYVLWPILIWGLRLWSKPKLYLAILLVPIIACPVVRYGFVSPNYGASLLDRILAPRSILVYADSLAVGCIGALAARRIPDRGKWGPGYSAAVVALLAVAEGCHLAMEVTGTPFCWAAGPTIQAFAVMGCIWLTADEGAPLHRVLNSRPMATIGVLSYSLYVWNMVFLTHFMGNGVAGWFTHDWKLWLVSTFLVAAASYRFVEVPFMELRSRYRP
jgi:peptidoglycan/LPS O-acetylase OafA/YrhL